MLRPHIQLGLCVLLIASTTSALHAAVQDDSDTPVSIGTEFTEGIATANRIVATVSGEPITSADIAYSLRVLTRGGKAEPELEATILRRMAIEILLAKEATRLGLDLSATQVDDRWQTWFGFKPDYEESAATAGTTVARQRALAKRTVLAELYVYNRVGLMNMPGSRIVVDLALKHMVDVTPQQLREYFLEYHERMDHPPMVAYAMYPSPDRESSELVADALLEGRTPIGPAPIRQHIPVDMVVEAFPYSPALATFVQDSLDGSISAPTQVQGQQALLYVVVQITGHTVARAAVFSEVQDELRNRIQGNLLIQAKKEIVLNLSREAVYYPANLFDEVVTEPPEDG
jgi:hypothetical protein